MGLTAKVTGGTDLAPIEAGVHLAVCYGIYDLGTHHDDIYGKDKHQIVILWEVPDTRIEVEREGKRVNLPRAISSKYTLSLGEKARLRKDLESWRGRPFNVDELEGFDLRNVLGKSCQLSIVHITKNDRTFAGISAIMGLPRGMKPVAPENEPQWFSMEEGIVIPASTPDWIKDLIAKSAEYVKACQRAPEAPKPGPANDSEHPYTAEDDPGTEYPNDDIPF